MVATILFSIFILPPYSKLAPLILKVKLSKLLWPNFFDKMEYTFQYNNTRFEGLILDSLSAASSKFSYLHNPLLLAIVSAF